MADRMQLLRADILKSSRSAYMQGSVILDRHRAEERRRRRSEEEQRECR
jgi:hypothetical protein